MGTYKTAMKGMADIRRYWPTLWEKVPQGFKDRFLKINTLPDLLRQMMEGSRDDFNISSFYNLIPWKKLTLADTVCRNYTVKLGWEKAMNAKVFIPEWKNIAPEESMNMEIRTTQLWQRTWGLLNWKYRLASHHEAYWKLLYRQAQYIMNLHLKDPILYYKTSKCKTCEMEDTTEHAYVVCSDVWQIWADATGLLHELLGRRPMINCNECEIVLAYSELWASLPSTLRMRVVL